MAAYHATKFFSKKEKDAQEKMSFCNKAECSVCCLSPLPMVQESNKPFGNYVNAMSPLFDAMVEYTQQQRDVIKSRFLPMIDATERSAKRSEWWDTRMFLIGFGTSLVVTIVAAINLASFIDVMTRDILGAVVLAVSSIGTAALGLRERLKFHETALIAKRLSSKLQRRGFLFLARADPYDIPNREACYANFVAYTEKIKLQADEEQMKLQAERDDHYRHQPPPPPQVAAAVPAPAARKDIDYLYAQDGKMGRNFRGGKPAPDISALRTDLTVHFNANEEGSPPTPFPSN